MSVYLHRQIDKYTICMYFLFIVTAKLYCIYLSDISMAANRLNENQEANCCQLTTVVFCGQLTCENFNSTGDSVSFNYNSLLIFVTPLHPVYVHVCIHIYDTYI